MQCQNCSKGSTDLDNDLYITKNSRSSIYSESTMEYYYSGNSSDSDKDDNMEINNIDEGVDNDQYDEQNDRKYGYNSRPFFKIVKT